MTPAMRSSAVFAVVVLAGCKAPAPLPPGAPPPVDEAAVTQALVAFWDRFAAAQVTGNVDEYLAMFAPDITLDAPAIPTIAGRAKLDSVIRPIFSSGKVTAFAVKPTKTLVVTNDLVLQSGSYVETSIVQGKTGVEYARYATSVSRGSDGQWRIAYWMTIHDSIVAGR